MAAELIPFPRRNANDDDDTPPPSGSPFIAALLAPLPDTEVPADSQEFRKQLKEDARRPWNKAQLQAEAFEAGTQMHLKLLDYAYKFDPGNAAIRSEEYHEMKAAYMSLLHRIMMMPAPDRLALRWKADRCRVGGRHSDWLEVWDTDNDRLCRRAA